MFSLIIATLALSSLCAVSSEIVEVQCDSINRFEWDRSGYQNTCHANITWNYDSGDFKFPSQGLAAITALSFYENHITQLPIKVSESFPHLITYRVQICPITKLAKKNFEELENLRQLILSNNKISVIEPSTFDDLTALNHLALSKSRCDNSTE